MDSSDSEYDSDDSIHEFLAPDESSDNEIEMEEESEEGIKRDLEEIINQDVSGGLTMVNGCRRSLREPKKVEKYVDSDYEALMFSDCSDLSSDGDSEKDDDDADSNYRLTDDVSDDDDELV